MEAWAQDLATALDETSSHYSHGKSKHTHQQQLYHHSPLARRRGNFFTRRSKSTGNLVDHVAESSSGSEGGMYECNELAQSSRHQTETDDGSTKGPAGIKTIVAGPSFAMPTIQNTAFGSIHLVKISPFQSPAVQPQPPGLAESDSLNETVSPLRPYTRRKRRFKRMAVDPDPALMVMDIAGTDTQERSSVISPQKAFSFSTFASSSIFAKPRPQRKTKKKPINVQKIPTFSIGKRKRSTRERSIECELEKISLNSSPEDDIPTLSATSGSDALLSMGLINVDSMDLDIKQSEQVSSSSVSGSESDPGFYTNDDGREADDEQSDWYQESGPTWGVPGIKPCWWEKDSVAGIGQDFRFRSGHLAVGEDDVVDGEDTEDDGVVEERKLHQILKGPWMHLSDEAKDAYKLRMQKLRDRIPGREIRAGRRHLGAQRGPSFSILTSANEKLSRFLQDSAQSEIRLHPMTRAERDQLSHLASLYSLQMRSEGARGLKCPVLKKTSNTMQAVRIDMDRYGPAPSLLSDFKRQRKTPPASVTSESTLEEAPPVDEANGSQVLKTEWMPEPQTDSQGPTSFEECVVRPSFLGLDHRTSVILDPTEDDNAVNADAI